MRLQKITTAIHTNLQKIERQVYIAYETCSVFRAVFLATDVTAIHVGHIQVYLDNTSATLLERPAFAQSVYCDLVKDVWLRYLRNRFVIQFIGFFSWLCTLKMPQYIENVFSSGNFKFTFYAMQSDEPLMYVFLVSYVEESVTNIGKNILHANLIPLSWRFLWCCRVSRLLQSRRFSGWWASRLWRDGSSLQSIGPVAWEKSIFRGLLKSLRKLSKSMPKYATFSTSL